MFRIYDAIARRKVEISRSNRRSAQANREAIMKRASEHSPHGADAVANLKGEITELVERIEMDEKDLDPGQDMPVLDDEAAAQVTRRELA